MGQPGMPMLTRLGNSGMWQAESKYSRHAASFYQEGAIASSLSEFLLFETGYRNIWYDMFLFISLSKKTAVTVELAHFETMIDFLVDWYPVILEEIEDFDEVASAVVKATTASMLTTRFYRRGGWLIVQQRFVKGDHANNTPKSRLLELFDVLAFTWSLTVESAASLDSSATL